MRCGSCDAAAAEGARFCSACGAPLERPAPAPESRRIVTVLFVDLIGSTALAESLDPEALRRAMDRYYTACTTTITRYGGVVEKFIGDAVMAVFGAFVSHEDDALRAVQAACAIPGALVGLNEESQRGFGLRLDVHSGLCSGEAVVSGNPEGGARVVGDVVNTAARLQSHAGAHEVLIGEETARLVGARVRMDAVAPLALKGKRGPVPAWRVVEVLSEAALRDRVPLVGRDVELEQLRQIYARVRRGRRCCLATVTGVAGIGKSRLVREFLADPAVSGAAVLRATCQAYGAGLTYRPLADAVWSPGGGWARAMELLEADQPGAGRAAGVLSAALDPLAGGGRLMSVAEIAWAFRCLVEALGRVSPLILVFEDLHWAEPTLLDLITQVVGESADAGVLVVCAARPELLEARPTWGGGFGCTSSFELETLSAGETRELVELLADRGEVVAQALPGTDASLERIAAQCGGNPLFAELLVESPAGGAPDQGPPATIRVLLEAWLDRLPAADRNLLERAATAGGQFTAEDVRALAADCPALADDGALAASLRRLLRSGAIQRADSPDGYWIARALARDTLYERTPKSRRAAWHALLADRFSGAAPGGEGEPAHHLESACRLLGEVSPGDPRLPELTARAARALVASGYRALHRRDLPAAVSLLERGRDLLAADDPEHGVLAVRISDACAGLGDWSRAQSAVDLAERMNPEDPRLRRVCEIQRQTVALRSGALRTGALDSGAESDLESDPDDELGWCRFHQLAALRAFADGRIGAAESAMREALVRARTLGDGYEEHRLLASVCELTQWSPTPVPEGLALCEELARRFDADRSLLVPILLARARLLALAGRLDEARDGVRLARGHASELKLTLAAVAAEQVLGLIESLSGAHALARRYYGTAAARLAELGQLATAATFQAYAARELLRAGDSALCAQVLGRLDPERLDTRGQLVLATVRARLAVAQAVPDDQSALDDAVAAAEQAVGMLPRTDDPVLIGDVWFEAAQVLEAAGLRDRARGAARTALASFTAKGAELPDRAVRAWLAGHGRTS